MIIALTISIGLVVILGYTTINLLKKQEKAEDILASYLIYLDQISRIIELSNERMKNARLKEAFTSDDEIGFFFKQLESIQGVLNEFTLKEQK